MTLRADPPVRAAEILPEVERAAAELHLAKRSAEIDRSPEFPRPEFRELGRRGLLGLSTRREVGGRGLPVSETASALCRLAYLSGTTFAKLSLQPEFSSLLAELGSPALVDAQFRPLLRGERLVGNHVTEPGAGADAGALSARAERVPGGYRITGTKSEAAFAVDAEVAIVYASVPGSGPGLSAFLVPQDLPGVERSIAAEDLGERWMRRGRVLYDGVEVPADHRLGPEGRAFGPLKKELSRERLFLAAIYLGVGRASFDDAVAHAGTRMAFGRALSAHEGVSFPLVEDWARLDAAGLYVERALDRADRGEDVAAESALAKWMATETALSAIDHAVQFFGGRGYSSELAHEQRWRDVRSGGIAHGPSEIMHLVAARALWKDETGREGRRRAAGDSAT